MSGDLLTGIAPGHVVALLAVFVVAALAVPGARVVRAHAGLGVPWARRLAPGWVVAEPAERWAAALLLVAGVVHLGLPLGHGDGPVMAVAFLGSGVAYCWLALRAVTGRRWRGLTVLLVLATLVAYIVAGARGEEPDQVGLATALVELAALGLAMSRRRRVLAAAALTVASLLFGVSSWLLVVVGHNDHGAPSAGAGAAVHHHDDHLARAQAGIIMRPGATGTSPEQQRAATALLDSIRTATARYADLAAAVADGYRAGPGGGSDGLDLHFEHQGNQKDGRVLDPARPEMLVYARGGGRAVLLGVVFQMPEAGQRGPQVGGATTTWHSHNICVGLLPPGFGAVTPFGNCPFLTAQVTIGEMMHVWLVDTPAGPFADAMPAEYARQALARSGRPVP
jgi:hypothetical protein